MLVAVPARAVRLPERAVPLLRSLAAAGLPGAGDAGGGGARADVGWSAAGADRGRLAPLRGLAAGARWCRAACSSSRVAADVRSAQVLGRDDTRQQARDWLEAHYPPELRVSIEPAVPGRYFRSNPEGEPAELADALRAAAPAGPSPAGPTRPPAAGASAPSTSPGLVARPDGGVRASAYHAVLGPGVIDDYRLYGYCLVMTVDVVRDRALETGDPRRARLLRRLDRESRVVRDLQPLRQGRRPRAVQLRPLLQLLPAASTTGRGRPSASTG